MSKSADRAEEFNRLLIEQATLTRSMKYGYKPTGAEMVENECRASRLIELAELGEMHVNAPGLAWDGTVTPEGYVNARIASWLTANPLALTNHMLIERVTETTKTQNPAVPNTCGVSVQIGEGEKAYHYAVMASDLAAVRSGGRVIFRVPESVAEHFRQQGRRALQREHAALMGYELKF